jgi:tetratricopeptide (TPR) repeat protein
MLDHFRYSKGQFKVSLSEVSLTGEDVISFLQTQCTYDINQIKEKSFQLISFLDPQGRVEFYGWLLRLNHHFKIVIPPLLIENSLKRLNKFLISEDVTISDPKTQDFYFILGPESSLFTLEGFSGVMFDELCVLHFNSVAGTDFLSTDEIETWRGLTGWPSFDGSDYKFEILNNQRLFDLALSLNKGCYPGQETVSKINTRRGAAYHPVLIETNSSGKTGDIFSFGKKIGTCLGSYQWKGLYYLSVNLLRDFRVEGMKIDFSLNDTFFSGYIKYFPLIKGDATSKAKELFYQGSDYFKVDCLTEAEECFRLAIKVDPSFPDAYESLGVMLGRQNRYEEAIGLMKLLSEVDPKSVLAHTNMSLYLMKMGKITEAEEQKSLATIKSFQSFGDEVKRKETENLNREKLLKEWADRQAMFIKVLEIDPEDTLANYGLGSIAVEKGEWESARTYLKKVLEHDPKYSVAYLALGKALKGLGLFDEAKSILNEGIKVSAAKGDLMPANQMQQELNF